MNKVEIDMETANWFFELANAAYKDSAKSLTQEQKKAALKRMVTLKSSMLQSGFYEWQKEQLESVLWEKKVPEIWEQILGIEFAGTDYTTAITKEEFMNLVKESER